MSEEKQGGDHEHAEPGSRTGRPFAAYEKKWQEAWEREGVYRAADPKEAGGKEKFYGLIEFPYPSGAGLHTGHPRSYTAIDAVCRKRRMEGKNVLYPIGWDAFGLPTENYAIKNKIKPQDATKANEANFERQLRMLGLGFDWSRLVDTTDPAYYKWTQWMFLQFFKSYFDEEEGKARLLKNESPNPNPQTLNFLPRMAYKAKTTINWCPLCKIGLANEEAVGGVCERCGTPVEKRVKEQWMIRITKYAERLLKDLDTVDYLEKIKTQQVNWIGRSEGASIKFGIRVKGGENTSHESRVTSEHGVDESESEPTHPSLRSGQALRTYAPTDLVVFTTRPDTLFGVTYVVLAPEHEFVVQWLTEGIIANAADVEAYRAAAAKKTDIERGAEEKEKTGVKLEGVTAINPVNGEEVPVFIADYVLANYGTGAVMAVPAHDERDFAFAKKYGLGIKQVVASSGSDANSADEPSCFTGEGVNVNSGFLDGLPTAEAKQKISAWLAEQGKGGPEITYKLRDWVFSRQRYWGEPIPIVICPTCGYVPVPEDQLPVLLPDVESYEPSENGESPLAKIRDWVETTCPACGGKAERETDTMPNWAGSSWYFLRYCDPRNAERFASEEALKYWMPVDLYNGGMEHTTLHLLYSRFWHKVFWDLGFIPKACGPEPYARRRSHGLIMAAGGEKMSKSKGNAVNPDDVVNAYGADVFRVYELFMGPFDQPVPWDTNGIEGVKRFLDKVWRLFERPAASGQRPAAELETVYHQSLKKVSEDIESLGFNTAISQLMILTNAFVEAGGVPEAMREGYLKLLAPFAPHLTEEIWRNLLGNTSSIHLTSWPLFDPSKVVSSTFELVIQVNGKVRDRMQVPADLSEEEAKVRALASENVKKHLEGKAPKKIIYVKGKLVTIAV